MGVVRVLHHRHTAFGLNLGNARRAVTQQAGQNYSDDERSISSCGALEEEIDRGAVLMFFGGCGQADVALMDRQVLSWLGDINPSGPDLFPM